jgi:hypothetical protein
MDLLYGEPVLNQVEHEPVAVVVVPGVLLVDEGRLRALVRGAQGLLVPVDDEVEAVGVERRDQEQDNVI